MFTKVNLEKFQVVFYLSAIITVLLADVSRQRRHPDITG